MNVLYLGCSGFPIGYAQVQKQKMISKALVENGAKVTVISYKGVVRKCDGVKPPYKGIVEGVHYIFASFSSMRPNNFIFRNALKVLGSIVEFLLIITKRSNRKKNVAIITTASLRKLKYYSRLLKLLNYKVVLSYEEFGKSIFHGDAAHAFDDKLGNYCDAVLPISDFLQVFQSMLHPQLKMFKLPVLADFTAIDSILFEGKKSNAILFCGASAYYETIKFIVDAFELVELKDLKLQLIIHGNEQQNKRVQQLVQASSKTNNISTETQLPYNELIKKYKSSTLLLIPLQDSERDVARFPHKISEYTASGTPLVTTAVGEINSYFKDSENAFVASSWQVNAFAEKVTFALQNPELSGRIAQNAYALGKSKFDYKSIGKDLHSFLKQL